jgi:hypothetical protein
MLVGDSDRLANALHRMIEDSQFPAGFFLEIDFKSLDLLTKYVQIPD